MNCDVSLSVLIEKLRGMEAADADRVMDDAANALEAMQNRVAVLEDLLETAYRKTDKARAESDKADDEALELKRAMLDMRAKHSGGDARLVREFHARAEAAESRLAAMTLLPTDKDGVAQ